MEKGCILTIEVVLFINKEFLLYLSCVCVPCYYMLLYVVTKNNIIMVTIIISLLLSVVIYI